MDCLRETPVYWVLAEYPSKSSPGTVHQVRTSKQDGRTYCTCRGWVVKLNQNKGEAICTHIAQYKKSNATKVITVYDMESYLVFTRGPRIIDGGPVSESVTVTRGQ